MARKRGNLWQRVDATQASQSELSEQIEICFRRREVEIEISSFSGPPTICSFLFQKRNAISKLNSLLSVRVICVIEIDFYLYVFKRF